MCVVWMASIIEMAARRNEYTNIISRQYLCICTIHTTGARYTAPHLLASLSNNTNITFAFVLFSLHILRFLNHILSSTGYAFSLYSSIHPSINWNMYSNYIEWTTAKGSSIILGRLGNNCYR